MIRRIKRLINDKNGNIIRIDDTGKTFIIVELDEISYNGINYPIAEKRLFANESLLNKIQVGTKFKDNTIEKQNKSYITKYNLGRIIRNTDISSIDIHKEENKINFEWFNDIELRSIIAFKLLFQDPIDFFKTYKRIENVDQKIFVYEGGPSSYHKNPGCSKISAGFFNYFLPSKIKESGDKKIKEFRDWFKENESLLNEKPDLFLSKLQLRFSLEGNINDIKIRSSGNILQNNIDLNDIESNLKSLIESCKEYYRDNQREGKIIRCFGKDSYYLKEKFSSKKIILGSPPFTASEIENALKKFHDHYKIPISDLLKSYYMVKYNPDMSFNGKLLEQVGFVPCNTCWEKEYLNSFYNRSNS